MAESEWSYFANGLDAATVARGVTYGITRPNGGGNFCFAFNSKAATPGAVGLYTNLVNFSPMAKGGIVRGAIKRLPSGGVTGFAPLFIIGAQGSDVNDNAYLLGLQDDDPSHIVLRKGKIIEGIPAGIEGMGGILRRSTDAVASDTWVHLRLDMIVEGTGDVILKCFKNDLGANPVTAPVWEAITGMADFIDDALGIATGSPPYTSGRVGWGFRSAAVTRRAAVDHLEVFRQL